MVAAQRVIIEKDPYVSLDTGKAWIERGIWPCNWVSLPDSSEMPFIAAFRRRFEMLSDAVVRVHVSADERYELYVDGESIGRGSERGNRYNWFYETYDLTLSAGEHTIVAKVWAFGDAAPYAQTSVLPGFILGAEGEYSALLSTGVAAWEGKKLTGYGLLADTGAQWEGSILLTRWTGPNLKIDGNEFSWGYEKGEGSSWLPVSVFAPGANGFIRNEYPDIHLMKPATLKPAMQKMVTGGHIRFVGTLPAKPACTAVNSSDELANETQNWQEWWQGQPIIIPPHSGRRVIIDLDNYYCAYPELMLSGGKDSSIALLWAESLYNEAEAKTKGDRNQIEGKYFHGYGDVFIADGGSHRLFSTLWWQAGRYLELLISTGDEALTFESLALQETRYPLEKESQFVCDDQRFHSMLPIALRGLQMCAHETYMDCPYYEQLMYVGDARLEALTTYIISRDGKLPQKSLRCFDMSRLTSGLTQSRYPSRVIQVIPPFSIWWAAMVYDYALWRGDANFIRELMPGVRGVFDCYQSFINDKDLLTAPNGWNFMDWVPAWTWGIPPEGDFGISGVLNWQYILGLTMAAELEAWLGEPHLSNRNRQLAKKIADSVVAAFWDDKRQLLADDLEHRSFSEHTQCLALLSGLLDADMTGKVASRLVTDPDLHRTTIYFTHYLFETYYRIRADRQLFERLGLWFDLEGQGCKTTLEMPEPSRSDCHGWGAHPIYHCFTSILGIRPASMGFSTVRIEPMLGKLHQATGELAHPKGNIAVALTSNDQLLNASISLPEGLKGEFIYGGKHYPLSGKQVISVKL